MMGKCEIKSTDDHRVRDNSGINIVFHGIDKVFAEKGLGWCYPCAWCNLPTDIKILQKQ